MPRSVPVRPLATFSRLRTVELGFDNWIQDTIMTLPPCVEHVVLTHSKALGGYDVQEEGFIHHVRQAAADGGVRLDA